jgi:type I restriction enzyme R subunit
MQLLIVVDKLLTGFDAIHCSYLYIDKEMQDHSLFQAICRTNRLGEEEETDMYYKEFGYIIDYKNLLKNLNKSITAYTSDAFDAFDAEDVKGLVTDRLQKAKERLQDALEALHKLCFDIAPPQEIEDYYRYFCGDTAQPEELKEREEQRLAFYKLVVALVRAYNNIAPEIEQAGYTAKEAEKVKQKVNKYMDYRNSVKHHSGDYIDMKKYEPDMRQMLDMYLTADPSKVLSNFGEATLLDLIVEHGIEQASQELPEGIKKRKESINETIENNMRQTIIQEMPMNPAHYVRMSKLLLELIQLRKAEAITYEELLKRYEELARQIRPESQKTNYPTNIDTQTKQVLYDNLGQDEALTLAMDKAILSKKDDEWRSTPIKRKKIEIAIRETLQQKGIIDEAEVKRIFELVENQKGY